MAMEAETIKVAINEQSSVTALFYFASKPERVGTTIILGHGAGANQLSTFMRLFARGLAARGFDVVTFDFLYMQQGRRAPDRKEKLESCYRAVIAAARAHKKLKDNRLAIGGKSMGGRIASQVAAALPDDPAFESSQGPKDRLAPSQLAGLVLLGYPLHPPGKPEQLRDKHLKDISAPILFVQGSRDAFGTPEELRAVIKNFDLRATLYVIESGDHSFKVPKSAAVPQPQIYENAMNEIARWLGGTPQANPSQAS